ncbi:MAG: hypothetical protein ACOY0T_18350 [Myxococcota bacterium]
MRPEVVVKQQALAGPILVSLTFDDSIDDVVPADRRDDGIGNRLEDGGPSPSLGAWDTRDIVGHLPGECGYRSARQTGGVANTKSCLDLSAATPCVWAERYPLDVTNVNDPLEGIWSIRTPSSIENEGAVSAGCTSGCCTIKAFQLEYPAVPCNDDGNGVYDRPEEYESRAKTIKGWIDNAIANPAPGNQRNWVPLVFHSICYTRGCNSYGIYWEDFRDPRSHVSVQRQSHCASLPDRWPSCCCEHIGWNRRGAALRLHG